jgi:hypothetical protein
MVSKLKAHEQRFFMRMDDAMEEAFQAKHKQMSLSSTNHKKGPSSSISGGKKEQLWRWQGA